MQENMLYFFGDLKELIIGRTKLQIYDGIFYNVLRKTEIHLLLLTQIFKF